MYSTLFYSLLDGSAAQAEMVKQILTAGGMTNFLFEFM